MAQIGTRQSSFLNAVGLPYTLSTHTTEPTWLHDSWTMGLGAGIPLGMWGLDAVCMCLPDPHMPLWGPESGAANIERPSS